VREELALAHQKQLQVTLDTMKAAAEAEKLRVLQQTRASLEAEHSTIISQQKRRYDAELIEAKEVVSSELRSKQEIELVHLRNEVIYIRDEMCVLDSDLTDENFHRLKINKRQHWTLCELDSLPSAIRG
jgi:hypothetical protein